MMCKKKKNKRRRKSKTGLDPKLPQNEISLLLPLFLGIPSLSSCQYYGYPYKKRKLNVVN